MKWFPDLVQTGKLVNKYLGDIWREQFLSIAQSFDFALAIVWLKRNHHQDSQVVLSILPKNHICFSSKSILN